MSEEERKENNDYVRRKAFEELQGPKKKFIANWSFDSPLGSFYQEYIVSVMESAKSLEEPIIVTDEWRNLRDYIRKESFDSRKFVDEILLYFTGKDYDRIMKDEFYDENLKEFKAMSEFEFRADMKIEDYPEELPDSFRFLHPTLSLHTYNDVDMERSDNAFRAYYHILFFIIATKNINALQCFNSALASDKNIAEIRDSPKVPEDIMYLPNNSFPLFNTYFDIPEEFMGVQRTNFDPKSLTAENIKMMIKYSKNRDFSNDTEDMQYLSSCFDRVLPGEMTFERIYDQYVKSLTCVRESVEDVGTRRIMSIKYEGWTPEEVPLVADSMCKIILEMNDVKTDWHELVHTEDGDWDKWELFVAMVTIVFPKTIQNLIDSLDW